MYSAEINGWPDDPEGEAALGDTACEAADEVVERYNEQMCDDNESQYPLELAIYKCRPVGPPRVGARAFEAFTDELTEEQQKAITDGQRLALIESVDLAVTRWAREHGFGADIWEQTGGPVLRAPLCWRECPDNDELLISAIPTETWEALEGFDAAAEIASPLPSGYDEIVEAIYDDHTVHHIQFLVYAAQGANWMARPQHVHEGAQVLGWVSFVVMSRWIEEDLFAHVIFDSGKVVGGQTIGAGSGRPHTGERVVLAHPNGFGLDPSTDRDTFIMGMCGLLVWVLDDIRESGAIPVVLVDMADAPYNLAALRDTHKAASKVTPTKRDA